MTGPGFDGQEVLDDTLSFPGTLPPEQIAAMREVVYGDLGRFADAETTYFVLGLDDEGRLFTWASESELTRAVDRVIAETV